MKMVYVTVYSRNFLQREGVGRENACVCARVHVYIKVSVVI
jgi:hypothetical protein